MQKKNWLTIAALATAVAGAIVAIVALTCYKLDTIYDDVIRELKLRHLKDETAV